MASHLKGRIDLSVLRESFRRELLDCLDKCVGSKAIVWDDALTGPFGLIAEYSLLKEHEVDKMFPLRAGRLPTSSVQNIVFIVRPEQELMNVVAQNVLKEDDLGGFRKEFHIFFVPRKSLLCEKRLKEQGVYGTFTNVEEFCLDFVPFDNDLLSLEMAESYRQCNLENDPTSLFYVAKGLMTLQALYGMIPQINGKGDNAKQVVDMMLRMRREAAGAESTMTPQIDRLLVLDRNTDPLTPLLSQLTYEGLIDEHFGISNNTVKLPAERFLSSGDKKSPSPADATSEPKKFILNSGEELYAELRDKNFNAVGHSLSKNAKIITAQYDARHDAKTVSQMKEFVSKLPHMQTTKQSLATHTTIAEMIKEVTNQEEFLECLRTQQEFINGIDTDKSNVYIEDCIAQQHDLMKILKLICIQSFCNNGLRPKIYDFYKREIIQAYGYQHMLTLDNLEKCRLLQVQTSSRRTYPTVRTSLRLIVEEVNELVPNDISYVFSGYAPLSVRLAERLHRPGWRSITEVLNLLPGPTIEEIQQLPVGLRKRRGSGGSAHSAGTGAGSKEQEVTLVLFLGGVTYAEVSALRHLSHVEDAPTDYIIATTKLINGTSWLSTIQDTMEPRPVNPF